MGKDQYSSSITGNDLSMSSVHQSQKRKRQQEDDDDDDESHDGDHCSTTATAIGNSLAVYWSDDDLYYRGKIVEKKSGNGHVLVKYEDGDTEWIDPATTTLQELEHSNDALPPRKVSPSLDDVTVGARLSIWWPEEKEYYGTTVLKIKPQRSKPFKLLYDDGEKEWTCLSNRKFVLHHVAVQAAAANNVAATTATATGRNNRVDSNNNAGTTKEDEEEDLV